jgi:hypothetical protein
MVMSLFIFFLTRYLNRRDKATESEKHSEKEHAEKHKKAEEQAEINVQQHTNFARQIEQMGDALLEAQHLLSETKGKTERNEGNIAAVKEALARVESQLATLLTTLLNQR